MANKTGVKTRTCGTSQKRLTAALQSTKSSMAKLVGLRITGAHGVMGCLTKASSVALESAACRDHIVNHALQSAATGTRATHTATRILQAVMPDQAVICVPAKSGPGASPVLSLSAPA